MEPFLKGFRLGGSSPPHPPPGNYTPLYFQIGSPPRPAIENLGFLALCALYSLPSAIFAAEHVDWLVTLVLGYLAAVACRVLLIG
jgi:hypothetical protein